MRGAGRRKRGPAPRYEFEGVFMLKIGVFCISAALATVAARAVAEEPRAADAYVFEISDVTAKVGAPTQMKVTARIRDGYRILKAYRNRVMKLSSFDDGVAFEQEVVTGEVKDGALVFEISLKATKPGKHAINGLVRVGYIHGEGEMSMVSQPLIANVTGSP
jgi:hypothetical protein